ncbi:hypothetical protein GCM10023194_20450 [Planotetraspora phitsanulokensis]|uniref:Dynamin N-terminal domain-containing protein n=1 Tax=Planotetraspora phitsanulokensis TaxID=575192 RepID=A0A8J3U679_9ACTN|nr:dynamin family protein [Planotetraspora phitsanulokensis]GII39324.1 hypothetical protein Pph01_43270 [Planotetraspora phitsanulokensis]
MTPDPCDRLAELCDATIAKLADPGLREKVAQVRSRLDAPLKVAVAGSVSSGKSTLVNALLGHPVALVAPGECTPFVTQYEYGDDHGRIEAELGDGRVVVSRLEPDDRLPADLGAPVDEIVRARVLLSTEALRAVTVVDTPGMNTLTAGNERAARRMLFGTAEDDDRAQALIYVLRYVQRFDDDILTEFRNLTEACGMTSVNTLAVLSQIDRRGDEDDPWPTARRLAARAYADLRTAVYDVVPVIGLLAETARTPVVGRQEIEALDALATLDEHLLGYLLLDLGDFAGSPHSPVPTDVGRRLVRRLHRYGIRTAVSALRSGQAADPESLGRVLLERSGFGTGTPPPRGTVAAGITHFARRAGQLKALAGINQLRRLARSTAFGSDRTTLDALAAELDETRPIAAGLAGLRIFAAVEAMSRGRLVLDERAQAELLRLARSDDPAEQLGLPPGASPREVSEAARTASARWRGLATMAEGRVGGQRAHDVLRVLEDLASAPAADAPAPALPPADLPAVRVDGDAVRLLRASPLITPEDRSALDRLLKGDDGAAQVGAPPGAASTDVAALAAALSARFRSLLHRPLPLRTRRAAETACDTFAAIALACAPAREDRGHADRR